MSYQTPVNDAYAEIVIKKSIFKSYAYAISSRDDMTAKIQLLKQQYPDARHHCWAYILGDPSNTTSAGFDDDGEPSGTAGKPILNVLQHKSIGNCGIIVVRYFGGIKLGAGGLTRAYSQSTQAVVDAMKLAPYIAKASIILETDFATEAQCRHLAQVANAHISHVDYSNHVSMYLTLAEKDIEKITAGIGGLNVRIKTMT